MIDLTSAERRALRARAHALHPVVSIGDKGLTAGVMRELDASLQTHELIKVKVAEAGRETRVALLQQICDELDAAAVQHIGKILVIYRPAPEESAAAPRPRKSAKTRRRSKRDFQAD